MTSIKMFFLVAACLLAGYLYVSIYKSQGKISEHHRIPVALDAGQMTSFVIGILLYLVFPLKFSVSSAINLWIGASIGISFSSIKEPQSIATGFFFGGLAAMMGTMVGATAVNPALCGLPISKLPISHPGLAVGAFSLVLLGVTVLLVRSSLKNDEL